jgi:hypothetical protein
VLEEVMKKSKFGKMRVEKIVKIGNKDEKEKERGMVIRTGRPSYASRAVMPACNETPRNLNVLALNLHTSLPSGMSRHAVPPIGFRGLGAMQFLGPMLQKSALTC